MKERQKSSHGQSVANQHRVKKKTFKYLLKSGKSNRSLLNSWDFYGRVVMRLFYSPQEQTETECMYMSTVSIFYTFHKTDTHNYLAYWISSGHVFYY